jgi:glycosyltransferase involved in cell wall biosynthesis
MWGQVRATIALARNNEVIYVNTRRAMVVGVLSGMFARKPVVWHLHDIVSEEHLGKLQLAVIKWCARYGIAHVIANSGAAAAAFSRLTKFDRKRMRIVYNGIPSAPFDALRNVSKRLLRERLNLPQGSFLAGSFGRLVHWKGQHVLLEAMLQDPHIHVVLAGAALTGEDEYEAELRAYIEKNGLQRRVHFLKFRHDVAASMGAVDVVVHTSVLPEPFVRAIVEGMLAQRPVVATQIGAVPEIIRHRVNGMLCDPDNAQALTDALTELRANPDLYDELVTNAYRTATEIFDVATFVDGIERNLKNMPLASTKKTS